MCGLILAMDLTDRDKALNLLKDTKDFIDYVKVGYPLILSAGIGIVRDLSRYSPVIADLKVADIPYTNEIICRMAFDNGAKAVISHGFTGSYSLKACTNTAKEYDGDIYLVVDMSSPGADEFIRPNTEDLCKMAVKHKVKGVVAPANNPERLKMIREYIKDLTMICPGVGVQGGSIREALSAGADYLIVGRSIYTSENPIDVAKNIKREIESF
ncbi:MAG TPA: orotidine-5'-phosphate decarboxylase [Halobacteria archaeon]|nr:orotidine-5'-phosphate decarboxylase [Halobacteria archaeon]